MTAPSLDGSWPHAGTSNGTLSDFVYNRSSVPGNTVTDALNNLQSGALPALTSPRTVYVNASTGNDSAAGTIGAPWQTLARAWADRQLYGELRATYTIQLQGVGPFTMPVMVGSVAGDNGFFCILGDPSVEVVLASGTFDGDITGYVVPTLAGLGETDEWGGESIKILTGNCAGARVQLATNTDTSITVMAHTAWQLLGGTAPGDTFEVRQPGSEIVLEGTPPESGASAGPTNWIGGSTPFLFPRHILSNVKLTGGSMLIANSTIALVGVRCEAGLITSLSQISCGLAPVLPSLVGATEASAWGVQSTSLWESSGCQLGWGAVLIAGSGYFGGVSDPDAVTLSGARINAKLQLRSGTIMEASGSGYVDARKEILVGTNSTFDFFSFDQILTFTVTSGDCLRASSGGCILLDTTSAPFGGSISGGTSDSEGGGLGCNARGGGRINWVGQTPTLTGGNEGEDIAVSAIPTNNASLGSDGDGISDSGSLSVIARIAAAA